MLVPCQSNAAERRRRERRRRDRTEEAYLAFAVGPKVDAEADEVVDGRVGGLVHEDRGEDGEGQEDEAELEGAVEAGAGDGAEGPLEGEHAEAEDEVDDLQDGDGLDGAVEILGGKVPEDLGPEEALEGGGDLIFFCLCQHMSLFLLLSLSFSGTLLCSIE